MAEKNHTIASNKLEIVKLYDDSAKTQDIKKNFIIYNNEMKRAQNKIEKLELDMIDEKRVNEIKIKTYIDEINIQKVKKKYNKIRDI